MKETFQRYAEIKQQITQLEAEAEGLKPAIIEKIGMADECLTDWGRFIIGHRRTYTYPEAIAAAEAAVKKQKKEAEQVGTASYVEAKYLIYKSNASDQS